MDESSYDPKHGEAFWCNACGQDQERSCGQDRASTRLPVGVSAAQLSRRRQGQTRATGQSVRTARGGDHRDRGGVGGSDDGARRDGVHDHPLAAARSCRGGDGDGAEAGLARAAGAGLPPAGSGGGADRVAGRAARLETVHRRLVARHHPRRGPGCGRCQHRRGLRRDGLAGRPAGQDRKTARGTPSGRRGESGADGAVRPVVVLDGGAVLPARRARLLPRRQERQAEIEYGILTDPEGWPVAVRVFPGDTADPTAFVEALTVVRDTFGLQRIVMVGDRGMITSARIAALGDIDDDSDIGWITALRAPAIAKLARDDGPLQMSLFDTHDLAEIACPDPQLATERARKLEDLLTATENLLDPIIARVAAGRLTGADEIGVALG